MRRREFITIVGGATAWPLAARAQSEPRQSTIEITGAWAFVSSVTVNNENGGRSDRWGPDAKGVLIFDRDGHFAQIIMRHGSGLQIAKSISIFGTYSIDPSIKNITMQIDSSSIKRDSGSVQHRRIISLTEKNLVYATAGIASGETLEATWMRFV
jgi:hypothetical protein